MRGEREAGAGLLGLVVQGGIGDWELMGGTAKA